MNNPQNLPKITHVAIVFEGKTYSLPEPYRHDNVVYVIARLTGECDVHGEQGFLDESGRFLTRKQALHVALYNDQVKDLSRVVSSFGLSSEDVW